MEKKRYLKISKIEVVVIMTVVIVKSEWLHPLLISSLRFSDNVNELES